MMFARRGMLRTRPMAMRNFSSSLLVPLAIKADAPTEIDNAHISAAAHDQLQARYAAFNEQCKSELQEMNVNIIDNIVARGGTFGWETDVNQLTKSFEFDSFEEAQTFVMRVGKDAELKDHHPEWSTSDGGRTVNVKLTSHFANNTVTRLDFELAEAMNTAYSEVRTTFKMYPFLSASQWASLKIGAGLFVSTVFFFKFVTGTNYEQREQAVGAAPSTRYDNVAAKYSRSQAIADVSSDSDAVDFAYGEYEKADELRPLSGV